MLSYAFKRIVRSWKLFAALILGMILAATFFGGINVGADTVGKQALDEQLTNTPVDIKLTPGYSGFGSIAQPASTFQTLATAVEQVEGVLSSETRGDFGVQSQANFTYARLRGFTSDSLLYQHLSISGRLPTRANETLVNANSQIARDYNVGDSVTLQFNAFSPSSSFNITLGIVGVAIPDSYATNLLGIGYYYDSSGRVVPPSEPQSVLIVHWEQTYKKLVDWAYNQFQEGRQVYDLNAYVDVNLNREQLISPWDVEGSISRVAQIDARVTNTAAQYGFVSSNYLLTELGNVAPSLLALRLTFIVFSIPVFFMAWYVGRTVSNAAYNLRRREIGLLMTKGFSRTQLFRHFLVEGLIVGLVSGLLGIALAFVLNPFFVQALSGTFQGPVFLSRETAALTVIFTILLTLLSIFGPARGAASMDPAKALREYVYVEDVRPSRKRGAIIAFSLGLYKIIMLILGINFLTLAQFGFSFGFLLAIIFVLLGILDFALTFVGPFLFLYGATQLSTGLAARFHSKFTAISRRLVGDIASLASKSVFRNPRRVAGLVFLVALIAGYSIWVTGDLASMEDYNIRQAKVRVGSDIRLADLGTNASTILTQLQTWNNNITGATMEKEARFTLPSTGAGFLLKGIDPQTWAKGAYYEPEWFSDDINTLLGLMSSDTNSVIMDKGLADYYGIRAGGTLILSQSGLTVSLRVIGLFGPEYSQPTGGGIIQPTIFPGFFPQGWSYVPQPLINQFPPSFSTTDSILVKAGSGVSVSGLADSIRTAYPSVAVEEAQASVQGATGIVFGGMLNVLRLGTVFAAAAACIGVGTVSYTGFKEREKETTMIAVRGLSYKQVLGLLITEVLPLVIFALILATIVGLITVRGDILALNTQSFSPDYYSLLAPRRMVYPFWAQTTLAAIVGLLLLGVFVPALVFARKNLSKMSRTVRFA